MILIQFLICGHTARAVCGLKYRGHRRQWTIFRHTARAVCGLKFLEPVLCSLRLLSYRASGMWIEIHQDNRHLPTHLSYRASDMWIEITCNSIIRIKSAVIPRERYVDWNTPCSIKHEFDHVIPRERYVDWNWQIPNHWKNTWVIPCERYVDWSLLPI